MPPTVSYDDELYLLGIILRGLSHGVRLQVSEDRFLERFQADITFLHQVLAELFVTFRDNQHLLRRGEYLHMLEGTTAGFAAALLEIASGGTRVCRALAPLSDTFRGMREEHLARLAEIRKLLRESGARSQEDERVISDEEFRELLADTTEEEQ